MLDDNVLHLTDDALLCSAGYAMQVINKLPRVERGQLMALPLVVHDSASSRSATPAVQQAALLYV